MKYTVATIKEKVKNTTSKLVSTSYSSRKDKLEWLCDKGHVTHQTLGNALQALGRNPRCICRLCNRQDFFDGLIEKSINVLNNLKGVVCLNPNDYKNFDSYLDLQCTQCNAISSARYEDIVSKLNEEVNLCPKCSRFELGLERRIENIKKDIKTIEEKGFSYIKYEKDNKDRLFLHIKCECGHRFMKNREKLHELNFCPQCRPKSMIEESVRQLLRFIFKMEFYSIRPEFMLNPETNQPLELDCYSEKKIRTESGEFKHVTVEIDGEQHSKHIKMFHKTKALFKKQQARDLLKEELCNKNDVVLVRVKVSGKNYNDIQSLADLLVLCLASRNVVIPRVDFSKFKIKQVMSSDNIDEFAKNVLKKSYKIIKRNKDSLEVECPAGHMTKMNKADIVSRTFNKCKGCIKENTEKSWLIRKEKTFLSIKSRIEGLNGTLDMTLNEFCKQESDRRVFPVTCLSHNHSWNIEFSNLRVGKWCRFCGHDKAREKQKENYLQGKLTGLNGPKKPSK